MANLTARGVVIKQSDYGEGHRMLSLFTEEMGIIKAVSYGAKRSKSRTAASTQLLSYGDFELYFSEREAAVINSADIKDGFCRITEDIEKLALCVYFADVVYALLGIGNPDRRALGIFLNSLYALAYRNENIKKIKAVYELKIMCAEGYMPFTDACSCGGRVRGFDPEKGGVVCSECGGRKTIPMNERVYAALRYVVACPDKKILSFSAGDAVYEGLGEISEKYLLTQIGQEFKSLNYYNLYAQKTYSPKKHD